MDFKENVIEWYTGDNRVTVSLNQKRYRNRIKRMAEKFPELVEIVAENADGTITARIPLKAVHLTIYGSNTGGFAEEEEEEESYGGPESEEEEVWSGKILSAR